MSEKLNNRTVNSNEHGDLGIRPAYLTWQGLAAYSSCSKRWLQAHVPRSLRFRINGKVLIRTLDFDSWIERYREGRDLDRMLAEILDGADSTIR